MTSRQDSRKEKLVGFNPNENGLRDHGIFGLPFTPDESEIVLIPLPFEATVSYSAGTESGPKAILNASQQIDLNDILDPDGWQNGIAMQDIPSGENYKALREKTEKYLAEFAKGNIDAELQAEINKECEEFKNFVKEKTEKILANEQIAGLLGGDHSVSLGYFEALAEKYDSFGILQIDAHCDLRKAYEGLAYSHASIFYNAVQIPKMTKLVQVGIRDFCAEESELISSSNKIKTFFDYEMRKDLYNGNTWNKICEKIVAELPQNVCISFDIDGLLPYLSPNTGTPVPGGLEMNEVIFLFEKILESGRKIVGFDLVEVDPDPSNPSNEWDGNVASRILYKLCLLALKSKTL